MKICITGIFSIKYPGHLHYKQKNSTLPTKRRRIQEDSSCILSIINSFFCQTKREGEKGSFQRSYSLLFHLIRSASHQLNDFVSCKPQKLLEVLTKTYSCCDSRVGKTEVTDGHLQERALSSQWLKPQCTFPSVFHSAPSRYLLFPLMSLSPAFATKLPLCIVSCPPVPAINSHC